jgi:hypothetical protein
MGDDRPVTLTVDLAGTITQLGAEAVDDAGPRGLLAVSEPTPYDSGGAAGFDVAGDDVLLLAKDRVVGIEGPADALADLLDADGTGGPLAPMQTRDAGDGGRERGPDPPECPDCGSATVDTLGGVRCPDCGWREGS